MRDELELKLLLPPAKADRLLRSAQVRALSHGAHPSTAKLTTQYFDTPDHALKARDIALRVREDGARHIQTVKLPGKGGNGLQHYREIETELSGEMPDLGRIKGKKVRARIAAGVGEALTRVFTTQFERKSMPLTLDDAQIELAVDQGEIAANGHRAPISEVELELKSGAPERLFELALKLHESVPFRLGLATKAARGYALASEEKPKAERRRPVSLTPDLSVGEAFATIARAFIDHLRVNEDPILIARDPEAVHQCRVAIRRFRAALWPFRDVMSDSAYGWLKDELRWMQTMLGPARDWEVFARQTIDPLIQRFPEEDGLPAVRRAAEQARDNGYEQAIAAIGDPRWTRLLLQLEIWIANGGWAGEEHNELREPAVDLAAAALTKRYKQLRKLGGKKCERPAEELHRVRVAAKKLRYLTEFFGTMFDEGAARTYSDTLTGVQDVLGVLNDAVVAKRLMGEIDVPDRAKGIVLGWQEGRVACDIEKRGEVWKAFRAARPYWS